MINSLFFPLRVLGWVAAAALAGAAGWKLGTYLAEVVTGEREPPWSGLCDMIEEGGEKKEEEQPASL
jgi:hypothetical protein